MRGDTKIITAGAIALAFALACGGGRPPTTDWAVVARLDGAAPGDVEALLLDPMEAALLGVEGLEHTEGLAEDDVATVTLHVRGDDPMPILDALTSMAAVLPSEAHPPTIQRVGTSRWFAVAPGDAERERWSALSLPGVEDVRVHGLNPEEIVVRVDPQRLAAYGLGVDDLRDAFATDVSVPSGSLEVGETRYLVRTLPSAPESLEEIVVTAREGIPIRLSDVAGIEETRAEGPHARSNGKPVAVLEVVSERTDLATVLSGLALDGWTRLDVQGSPGWAAALDGPDAVVLEGATQGTAWLDAPPEEARSRAAGIAGVRLRVHEPDCDEIVVAADDLAVLAEAEQALLEVPGTWSTWAPPRPELRYAIDREAAALQGVTSSEVTRAIALAAGGRLATFHDGDREIGVVLRVDDPTALRIRGVPLAALVRVEMGTSRPVPHVDARRAVVVEACDVATGALEGVALPPGATVSRRE